MWTETDNKLCRKFTFTNFSQAWAFMSRVALIAEKMDHHPYWNNEYNSVEIKLSSHDLGNIIGPKDHAMAEAIDKISAEKPAA